MIHTIHIDDPQYPKWLKEISDPPKVLYAQGNLDLLLCPGIAIVGMRRCSKRGENLAFEWARTLSRHGMTVISGLAFGIDAAAHRGAIAGGGKTIAVIPACLPEITPRSHRDLAKQILANNGLILSEWDLPRSIHRNDYLVRNRVVSGLSRGVLVVEAAHRSGALNTASHAIEQNRDVMAVPGRLTDQESDGCLDLLIRGATLVRSPAEIMETVGLKMNHELQLELPLELAELYKYIQKKPRTASEIPGHPIQKLTQLELEGLIKRDQLGRYCVA